MGQAGMWWHPHPSVGRGRARDAAVRGGTLTLVWGGVGHVTLLRVVAPSPSHGEGQGVW